LHLVGILFPHINSDARLNSHQISCSALTVLYMDDVGLHCETGDECLNTILIKFVNERGCIMTQTVSAWSVTAESRVTFRVNPHGVCGGGTV